MIKKMFFMLFILLIAMLLGVTIAKDPGYVLFSYDVWTMEMPLWLFVLIVPIVIVAAYFILRVCHYVVSGGRVWRQYQTSRHLRARLRYIDEGMKAYLLRDWQAAIKAWQKAIKYAEPGANYPFFLITLLKESGDVTTAQNKLLHDRHFQHADNLVLHISQARLLQEQNPEAAIAYLTQLDAPYQQQPAVLAMLLALYHQTKAWQPLLSTLNKARQAKAIPKTLAQLYLIEANQHLIETAADHANWQVVDDLWLAAPQFLRKDPVMIAAYARRLVAAAKVKKAERLIKSAMRHHYHPKLVQTYASFAAIDINHRLWVAEKWGKRYIDEPDLLLALGQLCIECQLWGKARDYLTQAKLLRNDHVTCSALGYVLEQFKETQSAIDIYRQGLEAEA